jgi:hypothetical protein
MFEFHMYSTAIPYMIKHLLFETNCLYRIMNKFTCYRWMSDHATTQLLTAWAIKLQVFPVVFSEKTSYIYVYILYTLMPAAVSRSDFVLSVQV